MTMKIAMLKKTSCFFLFSLVCLSQLVAEDGFCTSTHDINRVSIRHIESKGIGYNQGYTTLEGFFVPLPTLSTRWVPFLDLRGHLFNNGKPAANGGLGLRYIDSRVWGGNVYYDYRKTSHHNYNQISFGLESLGRYLDYRVNGYFPLGKHKGSFGDASFDSFSGNSIYIARKQELGLKGGNAEVGVHIAQVKGIDFYSALGPYYFGNDAKHTFGGQFRLGMNVRNILRLEGNTSYDHLFGWIGQGQISLSYAFTPKTILRKQKKGSSSFHGFVRERAFQRVDKQEIVVVTTQKKKSVAINPATGLPYVVWFVDNTSHFQPTGQGTYKSPFNTLLDVQNSSGPNDIIAVLPGDGTDAGMNNGITLQDGQKFWGMSILHPLETAFGAIQIKPLASQMPRISNSAGGVAPSQSVIYGGNGNEISGFYIDNIFSFNENCGVFVENKNGYYLIENNIVTIQGRKGNGIGFSGVSFKESSQVVNNVILPLFTLNETGGVIIKSSSGKLTIGNNQIDKLTIGISSIENSSFICSCVANSMSDVAIPIQFGGDSYSTYFCADNSAYSALDFEEGTGILTGIGIELNGFLSTTLRNNQIIYSKLMNSPSYTFINGGGASLSQINFAPDNVGIPSYSGF